MALAAAAKRIAYPAQQLRKFSSKSDAEVMLATILKDSLAADVADVSDVSGKRVLMVTHIPQSPRYYHSCRWLRLHVQGARCVSTV